MEALVPRPYQVEAISKSRKALTEKRRALVVLATALGKSLTSAWIWHGFVEGKGLFLAHTNGILDEAIKEYRKVFGDGAKFALYNRSSKEIEGADIVFATFQSVHANLKLFSRDEFAWMTVDESHHSQAKSYKSVIEHFTCPRLGITATPDRMDMLDIREIFGDPVINISLEEAIGRGLLPRIEYHVLNDAGFDDEALKRIAKEVMEEGRRISVKELNRRIFIRARDSKMAEIIERHPKKTSVFCRNIPHTEHFRTFLSDAETYHSKHSRTKNQRVLENLRAGLTRRVLSVDAFNEGIDVPDVGMVVFCRTTESPTIFYQQLGRGMRPGKDKLIALDFVGNIERLRRLKKMFDKIAEYHEMYTTDEERSREGYERTRVHLSGQGFDFTFTDALVDILDIAEKAEAEFYEYWQEAAVAAECLGITTFDEYKKRYKEDPHLPSQPGTVYDDWPGWRVFFGRRTVEGVYPTWQEAAVATKKLGITTGREYADRYREDQRLPSDPHYTYDDFPGYLQFLGKRPDGVYATWQEAAEGARRLGIQDRSDYVKRYKEDSRLPGDPYGKYKDFPGSYVFFGKPEPMGPTGWYPTWQEAAEAARGLGFKKEDDYHDGYSQDPRLPSSPRRTYPDFPGFAVFLETDLYPTWQEASRASRALGIKSETEYPKVRRADPRLPGRPRHFYDDFPGAREFFGT